MLSAIAARAPMSHVLKTDPDAFDSVARGLKTVEIRRRDRDYRIGDTLLLLRTRFSALEMAGGRPLDYSGDALAVLVTHIETVYYLPDSLCVMSILPEEQLTRDVLCSSDVPAAMRELFQAVRRPRAIDNPEARRRDLAAAAAVLRRMSGSECAAALRFHETAVDDGSYDIPTAMRNRLRELGLIRHAGRRRFAETDLMLVVLELLELQPATHSEDLAWSE